MLLLSHLRALLPRFSPKPSPLPHPCLGEEIRCNFGFPLGHCWEAVGPVRDLFGSMSLEIREILNDWEPPSSVKSDDIIGWSIFMVGTCEKKAKPTLLIHSENSEGRKSVRRVIEEAGVLGRYPGVYLDDCSHPPDFNIIDPLQHLSGTTKDNMDCQGVSEQPFSVFSTGSPPQLEGATIFAMGSDGQFRTSTGGLVLKSGNRSYLTTVAHVFESSTSHAVHSHEDLHGTPDTLRLTQIGTSAKVPHSSVGGTDYALVELKPAFASPFALTVAQLRQRVAATPEEAKIKAVSKSRQLTGFLSGTPSFLRLPGTKTFQEVWTIRLNESLNKGDCGAMVVGEHNGKIYGHIVVGSPSSSSAYILPASRLVRDLPQDMQSGTPQQLDLPPSAPAPDATHSRLSRSLRRLAISPAQLFKPFKSLWHLLSPIALTATKCFLLSSCLLSYIMIGLPVMCSHSDRFGWFGSGLCDSTVSRLGRSFLFGRLIPQEVSIHMMLTIAISAIAVIAILRTPVPPERIDEHLEFRPPVRRPVKWARLWTAQDLAGQITKAELALMLSFSRIANFVRSRTTRASRSKSETARNLVEIAHSITFSVLFTAIFALLVPPASVIPLKTLDGPMAPVRPSFVFCPSHPGQNRPVLCFDLSTTVTVLSGLMMDFENMPGLNSTAGYGYNTTMDTYGPQQLPLLLRKEDLGVSFNSPVGHTPHMRLWYPSAFNMPPGGSVLVVAFGVTIVPFAAYRAGRVVAHVINLKRMSNWLTKNLLAIQYSSLMGMGMCSPIGSCIGSPIGGMICWLTATWTSVRQVPDLGIRIYRALAQAGQLLVYFTALKWRPLSRKSQGDDSRPQVQKGVKTR